MKLTLFLVTVFATSCSAGSPTKSLAFTREPDAGIQPDAALVDSGLPDAPADAGADSVSPELDAASDSPVDSPADAPAESMVDAGWLPPDGAVSNAQLGAMCSGSPCNGISLAWSETGGRYYPLSCARAADAIHSLCTFSCDDGRGYPDPLKAADCLSLGGTCGLGGLGSTLYCIK